MLMSLALALSAQALPAPKREVFEQFVEWSPDSSQLAYTEYDGEGAKDYVDGHYSLWVARFDGSRARLIQKRAFGGSWSPDGKTLVYGSDGKASDIYRIDAEGGHPKRLTHEPGKDMLPSWSPCGDRIAFCSDRDGKVHIYSMRPDGTQVKRLTNDSYTDYNPAWDAGGRHIVFYREKGDRKDQIWIMDADGGNAHQVTDGKTHNFYPCFLPSGDVAYCSMAGDEKHRMVVTSQSGLLRWTLPFGTSYARWSPNGKHVAFTFGVWPKSSIFICDSDGSSPRKVVN